MYIYAKDIQKEAFTDTLWTLPNRHLTINTPLKRTFTSPIDAKVFKKECEVSDNYPYVIKVVYAIPNSWDKDKPLMGITPRK